MYKKVDFDLGVATIDGKTIGMEKDNFNGTIVIEGKDGTILFAEYGTLVDEEFYPFCRTLIVWTATGETVQIADIIGLQTRTMDIT